MQKISLFILWFILCFLNSSLLKADQVFDAVGGRGGQDFTARCPGDSLLRGVDLKAGDDVDQVTAVCAQALSYTKAAPTLMRTASNGGVGGSPRSLICNDNEPFVRAMRIVASGAKTTVVGSIYLWCGSADPKYVLPTYPSLRFDAPGSIKVEAMTLACNSGLVGVGIHGRSGAMVDAMSLICDQPRIKAPPAPNVKLPTSGSAKMVR